MNMGISADEIEKYLRSSESLTDLHQWATNKSKNRFFYIGDIYPINKLESCLKDAMILDVNDLDDLTQKNRKLIEFFITGLRSLTRTNVVLWFTSKGQLCELVLLLEYPDIFTHEHIVEKLGWDGDLASKIIQAAKTANGMRPRFSL